MTKKQSAPNTIGRRGPVRRLIFSPTRIMVTTVTA